MCSRNRPKFNTVSGLAPNGGGPEGGRPGSAPERNAGGSPRASRSALRRFFAPGTPALAAVAPGGSGDLPADVDELVAPLGRPSRAAGDMAVKIASAAPVAGLETENRPGTTAGPAIEPVAQPTRRGHRCVGRRVDIFGDIAHANPCTPPPGGPFAVWR